MLIFRVFFHSTNNTFCVDSDNNVISRTCLYIENEKNVQRLVSINGKNYSIASLGKVIRCEPRFRTSGYKIRPCARDRQTQLVQNTMVLRLRPVAWFILPSDDSCYYNSLYSVCPLFLMFKKIVIIIKNDAQFKTFIL